MARRFRARRGVRPGSRRPSPDRASRRAAVDHPGDAGHGVARRVQPGDRLPVDAEHLAVDRGARAALGAERPAVDLDGVERWLVEGPERGPPACPGGAVAAPAVVCAVAPTEVVVVTLGDQLVPSFDGRCEARPPARRARRRGLQRRRPTSASGTSPPGARRRTRTGGGTRGRTPASTGRLAYVKRAGSNWWKAPPRAL